MVITQPAVTPVVITVPVKANVRAQRIVLAVFSIIAQVVIPRIQRRVKHRHHSVRSVFRVVNILAQSAITAATGIPVPVEHTRQHIRLRMDLDRLVRPARLGTTAQRVPAARPRVVVMTNTRHLARAAVRQ